MRKTAYLTTASAVLMLGIALPSLALAQTAPAPTPLATSTTTTATTAVATPATPTSPPAATTTTTTTTTATPPSLDSAMPGLPPVPSAGPSGLTTSPATPKIVQDAVTGLQKTDPINLDDMIRAQDAINRLDLLLEIEKRQTELKKIRDERNKPTAMTAGIPASALQLPPMRASTTMPAATAAVSKPTPPPASPPSDSYVLKRIIGAEGKYSAVIASGSDRTLSVRPGETLPDGSKVKSVTLTSVSLAKDGKSKTLTIPSDSYIVRGSEELTP